MNDEGTLTVIVNYTLFDNGSPEEPMWDYRVNNRYLGDIIESPDWFPTKEEAFDDLRRRLGLR